MKCEGGECNPDQGVRCQSETMRGMVLAQRRIGAGHLHDTREGMEDGISAKKGNV